MSSLKDFLGSFPWGRHFAFWQLWQLPSGLRSTVAGFSANYLSGLGLAVVILIVIGSRIFRLYLFFGEIKGFPLRPQKVGLWQRGRCSNQIMA